MIRGMEHSTVSDDGVAVHVLSYLHDPTNIDLLAEIAKSRNARYKRAKKMAALLAEDFPITWELVKQQTSAESTIGRSEERRVGKEYRCRRRRNDVEIR